MPVTVKVNGVANSLVHKGSNGISTTMIPDVRKTSAPGEPKSENLGRCLCSLQKACMAMRDKQPRRT